MANAADDRSGVSRSDVIVAIGIVGIVFLGTILMLPRQRENGRGVGCQSNLRKIGVALMLYAQDHEGRLPKPPEFAPLSKPVTPGILAGLLGDLGYVDFSALSDVESAPSRHPGEMPPPRRIGGFVCSSDPAALDSPFPGPVNYRATTGDQPEGVNGVFAPGRSLSLPEIDNTDGLQYTAAFSERLLGDASRIVSEPMRTYTVSMNPLKPGDACPNVTTAARKDDAGQSWADADWRSSFYNHAALPNAASSCIATLGRSAFMGASSGHGGRVNVLLCDGAVRWYTSTVDAEVWAKLANVNDRGASQKPGVPPSARP
jgi:prepilin-type processing-associated H-X9-DG protein